MSAQQDYSLCSTVAIYVVPLDKKADECRYRTSIHTYPILTPPPPTRTHIHIQESQVTIECIIEPKHHRSIMGPKGSNVQAITQDHDVSIKFPDREKPGSTSMSSGTVPNGGTAPGSGEGGSTDGDAPDRKSTRLNSSHPH